LLFSVFITAQYLSQHIDDRNIIVRNVADWRLAVLRNRIHEAPQVRDVVKGVDDNVVIDAHNITRGRTLVFTEQHANVSANIVTISQTHVPLRPTTIPNVNGSAIFVDKAGDFRAIGGLIGTMVTPPHKAIKRRRLATTG